ncbi:transcriptional regulator BetI [Albidovulum sp.]|jgi:transcriptional repressor BetI|uniref:transcriptional regulator BetI n=1 Tax=Albidovulum sp. TaxID=1872424 RepID=UPI003072FBFF
MNARKRSRIEDIRREELILAAHRVFLTQGLAGLTTARICAEAGLSPGILAYYFRGKEDVLFQMVRYNNRILMEDIARRLRAAVTPWDRLTAIVEGNFPAANYNRAAANAWLSVCAAATANPEYARLQRYFYRRLASNLASCLKPALTGDRLEAAILTVGVMIDGLWLRRAADDGTSRDRAVAHMLAQIAAFLEPGEQRALGRSAPA